LLYLYGVDKALVHGAAAALRAVRPPNAYTGNGVMLLGEEVKLRQRAGKK
jgi:ribosomal protein L6P/L9E